MQPLTQQLMMAACRRFMRPIAGLLIRSGIGWKEFSEMSKAAYVDVAVDEYGRSGRPANTSRVAILTGLSRKAVTQMRNRNDDDAPETDAQANYASRVLAAWHTDPEFVADDGTPALLSLSGAQPAFATLAARYGGDMPAGALLTELKHVGAITQTDDGQLQALKRYYMPVQLDAASIERVGELLQDIATTVNHNLYRDERSASRFEGRATNVRFPKKLLPKFHRYIEETGSEFLYKIDEWLAKHEAKENELTEKTCRVGVGVYMIRDGNKRGIRYGPD